MAPFPFPKIVELREKYTYNITPFASNLSPEKKAKSNKKVKEPYISSDEEDDDVDQMAVGCLGLLSPQSLAIEGAGGKASSETRHKWNRRPVEVSALQNSTIEHAKCSNKLSSCSRRRVPQSRKIFGTCRQL